MNLHFYKITVTFLLSFLVLSCYNDSNQIGNKGSNEKKSIITQNEEIKLNNPVFFMGSTFGEFIQILHKTGKYYDILNFTSIKTKNKYTHSQLLNFYQNMQFSYPLKLKNLTANGCCQTLLYSTIINATQKTIHINVIVENDTCRIFFDKLNIEAPFKGM